MSLFLTENPINVNNFVPIFGALRLGCMEKATEEGKLSIKAAATKYGIPQFVDLISPQATPLDPTLHQTLPAACRV